MVPIGVMTISAPQATTGAPKPSRRRLIVSTAMWTIAGMFALTLVCKALRAHGYLFDMAANMAAHTAWLAALCAIVAASARRFGPSLVLIAVALAHGAWLSTGRAPGAVDPSAPTITILQFNALTVNRNPERIIELLENTGADLVGIVEVPDRTIELIHRSDRLKEKFPYQSAPTLPDEQNKVRLSRYPFEVLDLVDKANPRDLRQYILGHTAIIDHPAGRFVHALIIPISPRTPSDWIEGTAQLATDLHYLVERVGPMELPWILGVDMNAAPGTDRTDVALRMAQLRRAKPQWAPSGTWPSWLPGPARVAIDDLLVSTGVRVKYWRALQDSYGSDHVPVEAVVTLEGNVR